MSPPSGARRVWLYSKGQWSGAPIQRGGDEYGNPTLVLRLPQSRALIIALTVPLRRRTLPYGAQIDREANTAYLEFWTAEDEATIDDDNFTRRPARTAKLTNDLFVDYNGHSDIMGVELLTLKALDDPNNVAALRALLPKYMVQFITNVFDVPIDRLTNPVCETCQNLPPKGFTCNGCGETR
jgi:uncharacterized protein YuzE